MEKKPKICILRWEGGKVPEPLLNLENLPGNSTNPASYPFEIKDYLYAGQEVIFKFDII